MKFCENTDKHTNKHTNKQTDMGITIIKIKCGRPL